MRIAIHTIFTYLADNIIAEIPISRKFMIDIEATFPLRALEYYIY